MLQLSRTHRALPPAFAMLLCLLSGVFKEAAAQDKTPTPQWRPVYHFTPEKTWTNDPNGLFYLNGTFHLYYQNNPFDNVWGHMSWGHAISKDLVHWKYLPVAIPEVVKTDTTISIFSGSAVIDTRNTSGFSKNGAAPIVAIFTGDLPKQKKEAQYIAYSNDTGHTFTLYPGDPVIDLNRPDFRDPNVFWYAPTSSWVMAVSLVHEHKIRFYGSRDLKHWDVLSDFGPAGYTGHDWECPSLTPLHVDGKPSETKWILMVSCGGEKGPYMQYFVGSFDGKVFHNDNPDTLRLTVDDGDCFYAAIPWRLAQEKQLLIGWLVPGKMPTNPWRGQMSVPRDLSLRMTGDGLRLYQQPTSLIRNKLATLSKGKTYTWHRLTPGTTPMALRKARQAKNAYWLKAVFDVREAGKSGFYIAQDSLGHHVAVGYDANEKTLFVDCSNTKENYKSDENKILSAPLEPENGKISISILFDRSSLEVFGNHGQKVITTMLYPDLTETGLSIFSEGKGTADQVSLWDLSDSQENDK